MTVLCSLCGGCGTGEQLWQQHVPGWWISLPLHGVPLLVRLKVSLVTGSWLEPTCRRSSVVARFAKLNRWPILWLWPEVLVPATQALRWPYGSVGWSLVPLVPSSLPVTWFAHSLTLLWLLTSDDCVLSGYL